MSWFYVLLIIFVVFVICTIIILFIAFNSHIVDRYGQKHWYLTLFGNQNAKNTEWYKYREEPKIEVVEKPVKVVVKKPKPDESVNKMKKEVQKVLDEQKRIKDELQKQKEQKERERLIIIREREEEKERIKREKAEEKERIEREKKAKAAKPKPKVKEFIRISEPVKGASNEKTSKITLNRIERHLVIDALSEQRHIKDTKDLELFESKFRESLLIHIATFAFTLREATSLRKNLDKKNPKYTRIVAKFDKLINSL